MGGFVLLPEAKADLRETWTYSFSQWGSARADRYIAELEARFRTIAEGTALGRRCDDIREGLFRMPSRSHVIFYRRDATQTTIVRVLHKHMDFRRHL